MGFENLNCGNKYICKYKPGMVIYLAFEIIWYSLCHAHYTFLGIEYLNARYFTIPGINVYLLSTIYLLKTIFLEKSFFLT